MTFVKVSSFRCSGLVSSLVAPFLVAVTPLRSYFSIRGDRTLDRILCSNMDAKPTAKVVRNLESSDRRIDCSCCAGEITTGTNRIIFTFMADLMR